MAAAEPLTFPTKSSVPLTDLNANDVDDLNTALSTELTCKRRLAEATFDAHSDIVPGSESETETDDEANNHTGAASLLDSYLPKKNNQNGMRASDICLVPGWVTGDTVLNVMRGTIDEIYIKAEITEKKRAMRVETKAEEIADQMMLGKATVYKLKDI